MGLRVACEEGRVSQEKGFSAFSSSSLLERSFSCC